MVFNQARAFGMSTNRKIAENVRAAHFITYCLNTEYSEYNKYELAAYKFGGGIDPNTFKSLEDYNQMPGYDQVMKLHSNWWL
jgi:hypothetical protein